MPSSRRTAQAIVLLCCCSTFSVPFQFQHQSITAAFPEEMKYVISSPRNLMPPPPTTILRHRPPAESFN